MAKKFGILRFIGTIYKVVGIILGVIAIAGAIGSCIIGFVGSTNMDTFGRQMGMDMGIGNALGGILSGLFILFGVGIAAISQYAIGEGIYLLLAIEENTRAAATLLTQPTPPQA